MYFGKDRALENKEWREIKGFTSTSSIQSCWFPLSASRARVSSAALFPSCKGQCGLPYVWNHLLLHLCCSRRYCVSLFYKWNETFHKCMIVGLCHLMPPVSYQHREKEKPKSKLQLTLCLFFHVCKNDCPFIGLNNHSMGYEWMKDLWC